MSDQLLLQARAATAESLLADRVAAQVGWVRPDEFGHTPLERAGTVVRVRTWSEAVPRLMHRLASTADRDAATLELRRLCAIADACGPLFDALLAVILRSDATGARVVGRVERGAVKRAERILAAAGALIGDDAKPEAA